MSGPEELTGEQLRRLHEQVPVAVIAVDLDSRITYWNAAASALYGWPAEHVLGRSVRELILDGQPLAEEVALVTARGEDWVGTMEVSCRDGSRVQVHVHNVPLRDADGNVAGVLGASSSLSSERRIAAHRAELLEATARRLDDTLHRLQRLQSLTTSLLAAGSRDEVLRAVLTAGREAVGAAAIAVALADPESGDLRVQAQAGFDERYTAAYTTVPVSVDTPLTRAYLQQVPQAYPDALSMRGEFPAIPIDPGLEARAAVPILAPSGCLGGLTLSFTEARLFDTEEMDVLLAVSRQAGLALDRSELAERQRERQQRDAYLARATAALSGSLDAQTVVDSLLAHLVPEHADWVFLHLLDDTSIDTYRLTAVAHVDPEVQRSINETFVGGALDLHHSDGAGHAIRTREPLLLPELPDGVRERLAAAPASTPLLPVSTGIVLPLLNADLCLGAVTLAREGVPYTERDVQLLRQVTERAAVALSHASAFQQQRRGALELQLALLPPERPAISGLDIGWQYRPGQLPGSAASLIGGDWYDVVQLDGRVLLVVGDVMGRGPSAAAVMGQLRTMLRTLARAHIDVTASLAEMDAELQRIAPDRITTTLVLDLDLATRRMAVANAGHLPPVVHDSRGARLLELPEGLPLGVGGGAFPSAEIELLPGSTLVLYTDGLVEERHQSLDDRLSELVSAVHALAADERASADDICAQLVARMGRTERQDDDLALLVVRL